MKTSLPALVFLGLAILVPADSCATIASYVHVLKNETADTRFHLGDIEAFSVATVPDQLGGGTFNGRTTSTNDIGNGTLVTFGDGNVYPTIGTTTTLEHGAANRNPNNVLETAGNVWSTANGQAAPPQYTLDLGGAFDVTTVRLWPRADACCSWRWQNLEIQLLDENRMPIPGTRNLHTADVGNVSLEFTFPPDATDIEGIVFDPTVTFPMPADVVVLSTAPSGTPVGTLTAVNDVGAPIPGTTFSLIPGAGSTHNGLYTIGGPGGTQLLVNASLAGLDDAVHSVRLHAQAGGGPFERVLTFTVKLDSDNDGLIDDWETQFGVLGDFATGGDADLDGLNDEVEFVLRTNPADTDTDGDDVDDGTEIASGTDPNNPDTDGDGLDDGAEVMAGTNPLVRDTDGDTLTDGDEVQGANPDGYVTNPTLRDTDGDGFDDGVEIRLGTSPISAGSRPGIPAVRGRFVEVVKNDLVDTRLHVAEFEIFTPGTLPTGVGGGAAGLSTNDVLDYGPLAATRYLGAGTPTTTTILEHGGGSSQTNNAIETAAGVWSTNNGLGVEARYVLDLGESVTLDLVRIWARGDNCCTQRFQNLTINLYADDGTGNPGLLASSVAVPDTGPSGDVGPLEVSLGNGAIHVTPLAITTFAFDRLDNQFTITWTSRPGRFYGIFFSGDLIDWGADVDDSIESGGDATTYTFPHPDPPAPQLYFRVEEQPGG